MAASANTEFDVAVVGGGLVGSSVALGLARLGQRVVVLDEGDAAPRASRANFALVWVQSKGLGMPEYAGWTIASSNAWTGFAAGLKEETGLDIAFERPGGFHLALSEAELEARASLLGRLHNQAGMVACTTEILDRTPILRMLDGLGPEVVGGSYCPLDGHCNSLRLHRALHMGLVRNGASYLPSHRVEQIVRAGGVFRLSTAAGEVAAAKVVIAAGNASRELAPMVGLYAPMRPNRGQIIVTERTRPFMRHPVATIRQTDEGTVMIGDSQLEDTDADAVTMPVNALMAARAVRMFPLLGRLNVVRMWSGIRVMTEDGFPIYDQSTTHPGAFLVTCHSGVTLAAAHAIRLAPMIAAGTLDSEAVGAFSARRFDVSQAA
ncbi:MAG: FAD-binding oxidoreductase [Hyphomicrobiaceae bacterium]|nr:MAG: FAD-binding oxidoreductase [Hyphomicrobiaceae bacterium]